MAEFDPTRPHDATEAAYREALLGDDAGREQRRARLMAALPRPEPAAAVPVAQDQLARRWQPYALGLLATGLLLAAALAWRTPSNRPQPASDPRLAAAPAASTAVVVAQAPTVAEAIPPAAPPVAAKVAPLKPSVAPPVVVADATTPWSTRERQAPAVIEPAPVPPPPLLAQAPVEPAAPAPPPAAAPLAAKPVAPAAPVVAAAPVMPVPSAEGTMSAASDRTEALARLEVQGSARARAESPRAQSLAASNAAKRESVNAIAAVNASLSRAMAQADPQAARAALQAGASVQLRDGQGRTLLMQAARSGSREMVDLLLAAGARKVDRDASGWTAADHAQDQGHGELAEHLR